MHMHIYCYHLPQDKVEFAEYVVLIHALTRTSIPKWCSSKVVSAPN